MSNHFRKVTVQNSRLDPTETELRITVELDRLDARTEIKGRLMGPRCAYASTVEIAYPLKQFNHTERLILRAIIPEPSLWDPQSPFLYEGPLELRQDGALCDRVHIRHGIRSIQLTSRGLFLNGQPFMLHGKRIAAVLSAQEARQLHDQGFNSLLVEKAAVAISTYEIADQWGFVILENGPPSPDPARCNDCSQHPSCLGWMEEPIADSAFLDEQNVRMTNLHGGLEFSASNPTITIGTEAALNSFEGLPLPQLILTRTLPNPLPVRAHVIGWIESATA